jgi:hypothetical protein
MKILMALLLLPNPPPGDDPASRTPNKLIVHLADGSCLVGPSPKDDLVIKTDYGEQRVALKDVRSLRRLNEVEFFLGSSSVHLTGEIVTEGFNFDAPWGRVRIPMRDVSKAWGTSGGKFLLDTETVACWSFWESSGGACRDLVSNRPLAFHGFEISEQADGARAGVRKTPAGYAEADPDEAMEVVGGDFTLEARFKLGTNPRGYAALISKGDRANPQSCEFLMWVQAGGTLSFQSLTPSGSYAWTAAAVVKADEWTYVAFVAQPKEQKIIFYVNGKVAQEVQQAFAFSALKHPVRLGGYPANPGLGAVEKLHFFRISKIARTAEEIAELNRSLMDAQPPPPQTGFRGLLLRNGTYLRSELPKMAGVCFRTRYGEVRLDEKSTGEISLYRYRPDDLGRVESEVLGLIKALGDGEIDHRENASAKLIELGDVAVPLLRKNLANNDCEVHKRIEGILSKIGGKGEPVNPVADVLRVGGTVLHGWLNAESVEAASGLGTYTIFASSIESIRLGESAPRLQPVFRLKSGERLEGEILRKAVVELDTGMGCLSIPVREISSLVWDSGSDTWTVRTQRVTATGKVRSGEFEMMTPAGRLMVPVQEVAQFTRKP